MSPAPILPPLLSAQALRACSARLLARGVFPLRLGGSDKSGSQSQDRRRDPAATRNRPFFPLLEAVPQWWSVGLGFHLSVAPVTRRTNLRRAPPRSHGVAGEA